MTDPEQPQQPDKPKRKRVIPRDRNGKVVSQKKLVQAARAMLAQNMTAGDIKRQLAETYGMKPRSFERYIAKARERNREAIKRTADEAKSDSVSYWASKQQNAERTISQCQLRTQDAYRRLDEANAIAADESELDERREAAKFTIENCTAQIETYRKQAYLAQRDAFMCQQQVDRLLGNMAPAEGLPD